MGGAATTRRILAAALAMGVVASMAPRPVGAAPDRAPRTAAASSAASPVLGIDGSTFVPVAPCRVADSRPGRPWAAGERRTLQVSGGRPGEQGGAAVGCDVPTDATAAELSISVVGPTGGGYLRAWPTGGPMPTASFSNFRSGASDTNTGSIALGPGGAIEVRNHSTTATVDVVVDVQGYYVAPDAPVAATFHAIAPCRAVDSRKGGGIAAPRAIRSVQVAGDGSAFLTQGGTAGGCGVPEGSTAVELAISAVDPRGAGFLRAWPADQPFPDASVVNFAGGQGTTNTASVRLGPSAPDLKLRVLGSATHLVLDVVGYWMPEQLNGASGGLFHPMVPCRTADTRRADPAGALPKGAARPVSLVGLGDEDGGAPGGCAIPDEAVAVETAVTAVAPEGDGFLRAWPRVGAAPTTTLLNFRAGASATNTGALPRSAGTAGDVTLRAYGSSTHAVLDAFGWYSPPGDTVPVSLSNSDASQLYPAADGSELLFDSRLPSGTGLHRWHEPDGLSLVFGQPMGGTAAADDGSIIAFNSRASDMVPPPSDSLAIDLWTYEPGTDQLTQLTQLTGIQSVHHVAISGDGRSVGFVSDGDLGTGPSPSGTRDLYLYDRDTSTVALLTPGAMAADGPASLSSDGSLAAFVAATDPLDPSTRRTYLWRRSTGAAEVLAPAGQGTWVPAISADGSTVALELDLPGHAGAIALHDVASGRTDQLTPDDTLAVAPSVSGDGRFVTFLTYATPDDVAARNAELRLVDRQTGATTTIATGELYRYWPTIARDGRSVFFGHGPVTGPGEVVAGATQIYRWTRPTR